MTKEELAAMLNGREYGKELSSAEEKAAREEGLVIIFGASDDLCELRGAIHDEAGAWNGTRILISDGSLLPELDREEEAILRKHRVIGAVLKAREDAVHITAQWCIRKGYSWSFETKVPHATFDIMDDGEKYCRGIVVDLKELEAITTAGGQGPGVAPLKATEA